MIAVSDTSPICYLILIGEVDVLSKLYRQILIPMSVLSELLHADAPAPVRAWAHNVPSWMSKLPDPAGDSHGMEKLQAGERAAILLAESIRANMVLIDEKSARRVATDRGLSITGTLGILAESASRGWLDLPLAVDKLRNTSFRCSPALLQATLNRFK